MRRLSPPVDTVGAVVDFVRPRLRRSPDLRRRLGIVRGALLTNELEFTAHAQASTLHTLAVHRSVGAAPEEVTGDEMMDLYKNHMVRVNSAGRRVYERLMSAALTVGCPMCGQGTCNTLDHHLPKARYASFAIAPASLIPACSACNHAKSQNAPTVPTDNSLYIYSDNADGTDWLFARVNETTPASLTYYVDPSPNTSHSIARKIKRHFRLFKLASRFASLSAPIIADLAEELSRLGTRASRRAHLMDEVRRSRVRFRNSYQSAGYLALANSDWYCDGGYRM